MWVVLSGVVCCIYVIPVGYTTQGYIPSPYPGVIYKYEYGTQSQLCTISVGTVGSNHDNLYT